MTVIPFPRPYRARPAAEARDPMAALALLTKTLASIIPSTPRLPGDDVMRRVNEAMAQYKLPEPPGFADFLKLTRV